MLLAHAQKAIMVITASTKCFINLDFVGAKLEDNRDTFGGLYVNINHALVEENSHFSNSSL